MKDIHGDEIDTDTTPEIDFEYERAGFLLHIVEQVAKVAPSLTSISGEALLELKDMNEVLGKQRAEVNRLAKAKADSDAAIAAAEYNARIAAEAQAQLPLKMSGPEIEARDRAALEASNSQQGRVPTSTVEEIEAQRQKQAEIDAHNASAVNRTPAEQSEANRRSALAAESLRTTAGRESTIINRRGI